MNFAAMAYLFHKGKVLVVKHLKSGLWLPVGGHQEDGETVDETLSREIKEEVNLKAKFVMSPLVSQDSLESWNEPIPILTHVRQSPDGKKITVFEYVGVVEDISTFDMNFEELGGFKWLTRESAQMDNEVHEVIKRKIEVAFDTYENLD